MADVCQSVAGPVGKMVMRRLAYCRAVHFLFREALTLLNPNKR